MKHYLSFLFIILFTACGGGNGDNPALTPAKNRAPGNFTVNVGEIKNTQATVTWTNATDPDGDKITYSFTQGSTTIKNIAGNSYTVTNLTKDTNYSGYITASDDKGANNKQNFSYTTTNTPNNTGSSIFIIPNNLKDYYKNIDFRKSGIELKNDLASLTIEKHTQNLSYNEAKKALKITDLVPNSSTHVYLLYGFSDDTCNSNTTNDNDHKTRNKNSFGGGATCEWNREHTYAKSLGSPNLGTAGAGADVHHLRACDVQRNSYRGSLKFTDGNGNSKKTNNGWYPGDEWKGDVARMLMYMYLRYGNQCLPKSVAIGKTNTTDNNMINLLLKWNAEDKVSTYEINRNNYLENSSNAYYQGNRNPFIDNPYLATKIWGNTEAENLWK